MSQTNQSAYVLGSARIPFVKSWTSYSKSSTQELMLASLKALVKKYKLEGKQIGDVAFGAVMKSSMDWNLSRECVLLSGLHRATPAYDVTRACGTSLESVLQLCHKIESHEISTAIAGGVDSNSDLPFLFSKSFSNRMLKLRSAKTSWDRFKISMGFRLQDFLPIVPGVVEPQTGLSMGQHTEKMVQEWKISRQDQDELAFQSHQKGAKAYSEGFYNELVFPFQGVERDGILRADTKLEKLAQLKPVFAKADVGTLTAGNSTALTDGSATVLLGTKEAALSLGLRPLARIIGGQAAALDFVAGEGLLMAPALAVGQLLQRLGLEFSDFDFFEIHEAFAGQVLCTLKAWESDEFCRKNLQREKALGSIPREKMNVKGGSLALGHPFAATGARIVGALGQLLANEAQKTSKKQRGLISICTAGGMGVCAVLESAI